MNIFTHSTIYNWTTASRAQPLAFVVLISRVCTQAAARSISTQDKWKIVWCCASVIALTYVKVLVGRLSNRVRQRARRIAKDLGYASFSHLWKAFRRCSHGASEVTPTLLSSRSVAGMMTKSMEFSVCDQCQDDWDDGFIAAWISGVLPEE